MLRVYARENRANMTLAESVLWEQIRGRKLGYTFLRQYPILDYIVDFICREKDLVIEVDGAYHCERDQATEDAIRQHHLEAKGLRVVRFTNKEVLYNTDHVIETIKQQLKD